MLLLIGYGQLWYQLVMMDPAPGTWNQPEKWVARVKIFEIFLPYVMIFFKCPKRLRRVPLQRIVKNGKNIER